jgi:FMN phosphatase YigB (HAD superfamily)
MKKGTVKTILALVDFDDTIVVSAIHFWKNYADFMVYLYEEICKEKGDNPYSHTPTIQEALSTLETFEAELLLSLGYTPSRMGETFRRVFVTFDIELTNERVERISEFSTAPFDAKLSLNEDVKKALEQLSQFAKIVIWTRGSQEIQERRISSIDIGDYISSVRAFNDKSPENLQIIIDEEKKELCVDCEPDDIEVWMIGNSIEHDVLPAMNIGVNAILVGATGGSSNWFRSFIMADDMQKAVDLIIGASEKVDKETLSKMFR